MIGERHAEYSRLWHGECTALSAARMTAIELEVAATEPTTLTEANQKAAVALGATGSLAAGRLLAPALTAVA